MNSVDIGQLLASLGLDTKQYTASLAVAQAAMSKADGAIKNTQTSLQRFETKLGATSQRLRTFGYLATATLTVPLVMLGKTLAKTSMEFEASMAKIEGLVGISHNTIMLWSQDLLRMGKETAQSPLKLAEALYYVTSAGFKTADALKITRTSALAASSGMGEAMDVANMLTSVMNAYRTTGLSAARAMDIFTAAVREGKIEPEGFANAMGSVVPIAAAAGATLEDVAGIMASMSLTGSNAAQSATYLRNILQKLIDPSKETSDALARMNTSQEELSGILREKGLLPLLEVLKGKIDKYGESVGAVFPNIRSLIGFLSVTGENLEYNRGVMDAVTKSTGDFNKNVEVASKTMKYKYDTAMASLTASKIRMGVVLSTILIPLIEKLANAVEGIAGKFTEWDNSSQKLTITLVGLAAAAGPAFLGLSLIGYGLQGLTAGYTALLTILKGLRAVTISGGIGFAVIPFLPNIDDAIQAFNRWRKTWRDHKVELDDATRALLNYNSVTKSIPGGSKNVFDLRYQQVSAMAEVQKVIGTDVWKKMNPRQLSEFIPQLQNFKKLLEDIALTDPWALVYGKDVVDKIDKALKVLQERAKSLASDIKYSTPQLGLIEAKQKEIDALQEKINTTTSRWDLERKHKELEVLKKDMEDLLKPVPIPGLTSGTLFSGASGIIPSAKQDTIPSSGTGFLKADVYVTKLDAINKALKEGDRLTRLYANTMSDLGLALGEALYGQEGAMKGFFQTMLRGIAQIINELLVMAVAGTLAWSGTKGGIIGLLLAATVGVGIITAALNKAPEFAHGGLVYGDTLARVGEYPGASTNPEVIAPLSKLQGILGGAGGGEVRFEIEGTRLVGILNKMNRKLSIT